MQTALQNNAVSKHLKGKRIVLASASPRRKEILEECLGWTGFEVIPSTFDETLPHADYVGREEEYPVDTAAEKVRALSCPFLHMRLTCSSAGAASVRERSGPSAFMTSA